MMPGMARPEGAVLCHEHEGPLLDLLQDIGLAVGVMDIDVATGLIDEGLVPLGLEVLPGVDGVPCAGGGVRAGADIVVAGVEPAADVQARDVLPWLVARLG